jgi:prepilin-type N-terminal cleavage/methylation domain-containing protein
MTNQRGYTILELMMVVCIIGVLSMVAMTEYNKVHNRAYVGAAMNDLQALRKAVSLYDAEWGVFPQVAAATSRDLCDVLLDPTGEPYLSKIPGTNFDAFTYVPPAAGDEYGDYSMIVVCKDHWRTQITVHSNDQVDYLKLN